MIRNSQKKSRLYKGQKHIENHVFSTSITILTVLFKTLEEFVRLKHVQCVSDRIFDTLPTYCTYFKFLLNHSYLEPFLKFERITAYKILQARRK